MRIQDTKYLLIIPVISVIFYFAHSVLLSYFTMNLALLHYKNSSLFITFTALSILIIGILIYIKTKNLDLVGMSFLVLTSAKMVVSYILVRPILALSPNEMSMQKINFFSIFIIFLAIETIITIRILNNK